VCLAEGRFSSNLDGLIAKRQFTPFIALVNNARRHDEPRDGWQSRFLWIVEPGTASIGVHARLAGRPGARPFRHGGQNARL
jgi:hypothetical protein